MTDSSARSSRISRRCWSTSSPPPAPWDRKLRSLLPHGLIRFNRSRLQRPVEQQKIDKTLVEEYLKDILGKGYAPATIERSLASLRWYVRGVIDLLHDNSFLQQHLPSEKREELLERAKRCLRAKKPKGSRGEGIEAGRYVPLAEINLLMESFSMDETKAGCRDRAMLAIGWRLGPRVSEIAGLSLKSITPLPLAARNLHTRS